MHQDDEPQNGLACGLLVRRLHVKWTVAKCHDSSILAGGKRLRLSMMLRVVSAHRRQTSELGQVNDSSEMKGSDARAAVPVQA